jgi:hypothetical protein
VKRAAKRRPTAEQRSRAFHAQASALTAPGRHAARFAKLPRDVEKLSRIVRGLVLHEHAAPHYGVKLADSRREESHIRPVEQLLDTLLARDPRPLGRTRAPEERLVGVCRHFAVLLTAMLRSQGVPARARCGFASYFVPGAWYDHWVCEHWSPRKRRWVRADAQLDAVQKKVLGLDFDPQDVPRDRFLDGAEAWKRCRAGKADPADFGIFELRGLWFVAGDLLRDFAALNHVELLAWDAWGAMPGAGDSIDAERLALFDRVAKLCADPDRKFDALRACYADEASLRVPEKVFNALRSRLEAL